MGLSLVTLAEYKAYTGKSSTTDDSAISSIIPKVSELVKSICRRSFVDYAVEPKLEQFNSGDAIILEEPRILTVYSVEFSTDYGLTYTDLVEYEDYVLDKKADQIKLINKYHSTYNRFNAFKVTYIAGYERIPGQETLPGDLKIAILDLVTYYLRNETAVSSNKGIGLNSVAIEYITNTKLPAHISRILDLYAANYL